MCPATRFFAVETNLSFWCDLESFDKKVWPVTHFFAVQTVFSFWWDLEKFQQKCVPSYTFFRCGDYLKFLMGLGQIFTKKCAQSYVSWLWRLTWDFDGTWKNFHEKSVPSHTFLRCGDYLKFLRGLGKFRQKGVTSYTVFRSADYLKFLMGLGKSFTKKCAQSHVSSLWRLS